MDAEQPLHGQLKHCRKLKNKRLGLRIVFTEAEENIEVIATGKRSDKEVYENAINRLKSDE
ncbi:hypothetical protein [Salinicoccus sp. HZC-1]|uniref:hypothetical protein n=1 Tax=Salinicoccus sp. HZC-1 TaxID=3385497 RepID=UPI00398A8FB0